MNNIPLDVKSLWDCIWLAPKTKEKKIVHVYLGGYDSVQSGPFLSCWKNLDRKDNYILEVLYVENVRSRQWQPKDVINWLLCADYHFICAHIHQGLQTLAWDMQDLVKQLRRLHHHQGFPNGIHLSCPIFIQDKYLYIKSIPFLCNNTMTVKMTADYDYFNDELTRCIRSFVESNTEGCGWVVKAPFTTNCQHIKYCSSVADIQKALVLSRNKFYSKIPYMMVQARMKNGCEKKVVCFNRKALYVSSCSRKASNVRKMSHDSASLLKFAEFAVNNLEINCKEAIVDGLIRVDIFENIMGKLVVNEFESLEAVYYSKDDKNYCKMTVNLENYWKIMFEKFLRDK